MAMVRNVQVSRVSNIRVHEVTEEGRVLWIWDDPDATDPIEPVELTPMQMQHHGLVDFARAAISERLDAAADPFRQEPVIGGQGSVPATELGGHIGHHGEPQKGTSEATGERPRGEAAWAALDEEDAPSGGPNIHPSGWRTIAVEDEGRRLWVIDNKPQIEAYDELSGEPRPTFQHVVVPAEVVSLLR